MKKDENIVMAYLAGIIDGDGSMGIAKRSNASKNPLYLPVIQCAAVMGQHLEVLREYLGGTIHNSQKEKISKKTGNVHRPQHAWIIQAREKCSYAIKCLLPHLKVKKSRAEFILNFIENFTFIRGGVLTTEVLSEREDAYLKMKFMNTPKMAKITSVRAKNLSEDPIFWSYVAGIVDTEGSFSIKKQTQNKGTRVINPRYIPCFYIVMCDGEAFSYLLSGIPFGNFSMYKNKASNLNFHYNFQIHSKKDGAIIVEKLLPFLRTKKERAEVFLEFCKRAHNTGYCKKGVSEEQLKFRDEKYNKLKNLNKYGVYKPSLIDLEIPKRDDRGQAAL